MNRQQEEALEAAKLAAMVGSQLKAVDQMTVERHNVQANRININSFVNKVKGVQPNQNNGWDSEPSNLQQKAMEAALREAAMIPEPVMSYSTPQLIPMPSTQASDNLAIPSGQIGSLSETISKLENNVEKIGNTLDSLLELIQTTLNQNER
jgi:hypothetical protein